MTFSVKYGKTQIFRHNTHYLYFQGHCSNKDQLQVFKCFLFSFTVLQFAVFNGTLSYSHYMALNDLLILLNELGWVWSLPNLRYYPRICFKALGETLSVQPVSCQDSNWAPPDYMSDILSFEPACSINTLYDCQTVLIYLCANPLHMSLCTTTVTHQ